MSNLTNKPNSEEVIDEEVMDSHNGWQNNGAMMNYAIDEMREGRISTNEFSILMVLVRYSFGYREREVRMSVSQLMDITGLSNKTIIKIMTSLQDKGYISRKKNYAGGVKTAYVYRVKFINGVNVLFKDDTVQVKSLNNKPIARGF